MQQVTLLYIDRWRTFLNVFLIFSRLLTYCNVFNFFCSVVLHLSHTHTHTHTHATDHWCAWSASGWPIMKLIWGDLTGVQCAGGGGGGAADSCAAGGRQTCNANADCTDYETGFCCHCSSPYIGNGYDCVRPGIQGWAKKPGYRRLITVILSVVNRFKNFFHWKIPW